MTGLSYLFSIIAVLLVVRWLVRVEKSNDSAKTMHSGIFGIKEDEKPKVSKTKVQAPWDARSFRNERGENIG